MNSLAAVGRGRGEQPALSFDWVVFLRRKPIMNGGEVRARLVVQATLRVPVLTDPWAVSLAVSSDRPSPSR